MHERRSVEHGNLSKRSGHESAALVGNRSESLAIVELSATAGVRLTGEYGR